ncbi:MAG: potassium channel family protein [Methyloceanibacter sp.]|uniref:potassium channel family protein n=1 Tax=Methyloceanibacter sp. TaxID=1965321 RepID=UPI003D9AE1FB
MWEARLVGGATSMVNLIIHALLMAIVVRTVQRLSVAQGSFIYDLVQRTVVIVATGTLLVAGHYVEVILWAFTYGLAEAAAPGTDLVYFAFGNYTTLGYGDVLPVERWQMLGPLTALNGIMLIGWSTAVILEVLRRTDHGAVKSPKTAPDTAKSGS